MEHRRREAEAERRRREAEAESRLREAEAAHDEATAPVNYPVNYVFHKNGCAMVSYTVKAWHACQPGHATISKDICNMYNTTDQPTDEDNNPDPSGHGRERMFGFFRRRFPQLVPAARLVLGRPSLIRLDRQTGAVPLPGEVMDVADLAEPDPDDPRLLRSCCGGVQGRAFSTLGCVGLLHEEAHAVQKRHPTTRMVGQADDYALNDEPAALCATYDDMVQHQASEIGLFENVTKAVIYSPSGNLSCAPATLPGSPNHEHGVVQCFKMVGTYFGSDEACKAAIEKRVLGRVTPSLDAMDRAREAEGVTGVGQLKHNLLRYTVGPVACYTAQVAQPSIAARGLDAIDARTRQTWEIATEADSSPPLLRDHAWDQARMPGEGFGGLNLTKATCDEDVDGVTINYRYSATLLGCWPGLRSRVPDLATVDPLGEDAPQFIKEAFAGYEEMRRRRATAEQLHATLRKEWKRRTRRGGEMNPAIPPGLPLPESFPSSEEVLDPTSKKFFPSQGKLAAVDAIHRWHALKDTLRQRDEATKSCPQDGDSKVPRREQARLVSVSQPYAGAWHSVPGDGTGATVLESKLWVAGMQRHLGLHLSASKDALKELLEAGGGRERTTLATTRSTAPTPTGGTTRRCAAGTTPWRRSRPRRPCWETRRARRRRSSSTRTTTTTWSTSRRLAAGSAARTSVTRSSATRLPRRQTPPARARAARATPSAPPQAT